MLKVAFLFVALSLFSSYSIAEEIPFDPSVFSSSSAAERIPSTINSWSAIEKTEALAAANSIKLCRQESTKPKKCRTTSTRTSDHFLGGVTFTVKSTDDIKYSGYYNDEGEYIFTSGRR